MCCHSRIASAGRSDTNYEEAVYIYNQPQGKEDIVTVPGDHLPLPKNHTPSPLAP